jgi:hypothetical protein
MLHYLIYAALIYLATGVVFCEVVLWIDRKHGGKTTINQYCNLTFAWPIVLWVAYSHKLRRRK